MHQRSDASPLAPAQPELACVVLSLRDEHGLVDAVRSILDQGVPVEVVVVNSGGGSPEHTLRSAGLDVPVVDHAHRLLPGGARNAGIDATRARYVAFLAADCIAMPGWVAGRLRAHRAGAAAVAGAMGNAYPWSRSACAASLLLHHRRLPDTPAEHRLLYSISYDRALFERFGRFRDDLRTGEDTEFNARLRQKVTIAWAPDVRIAHRNPTRVRVLLHDQYHRGRRRAAAHRRLASPRAMRIACAAAVDVARCLRQAWRTRDAVERRQLLRAWPLLPPAALVYAAGAVLERFTAEPAGEH